tara:strand:+ start:1869 stop:2204 length:336 start_codon:yes stop_codon:yes gene_type:complete
MDFDEIQKLIIANAERYSKKHQIDIDLEWLLLKLTEESGEFANALLIYRKKCRQEKCVDDDVAKDNLSKELVDVFTTLILLGDKLDIDVLDSMDRNVLEKGRRYLESQSAP